MQTLRELGADISAARRRRRLPGSVLADRAFISRQTLAKIEAGDPAVSMGAWVSVLFGLGLDGKLRSVAALEQDALGQALSDEQLPLRVYGKRRKRASPADEATEP
jgi:transcriptional regulator with XRE-family HTH domain